MTETAPFVFWNEACEKGTHDSAAGDTGYNVVGEDTESGMMVVPPGRLGPLQPWSE